MKAACFILFLLAGAVFITGCKDCGCTDPLAKNFCGQCDKDDGSCLYDADELVGDYYAAIVDSHWGYIDTSATSGYLGWEVFTRWDTLRITSHSKKDSVFISLLHYGDAKAKVKRDSLIVPSQGKGYCGYCLNWQASGEGVITGDSIFFKSMESSTYNEYPYPPPDRWKVWANGKKL